VGDEWAHAEFLAELVVMGFGLHSLGGIAVRGDVTETPEVLLSVLLQHVARRGGVDEVVRVLLEQEPLLH
jgi:hypothetical protein